VYPFDNSPLTQYWSIERDTSGMPLRVSKAAAREICESRMGRLPNLSDIRRMAYLNGAKSERTFKVAKVGSRTRFTDYQSPIGFSNLTDSIIWCEEGRTIFNLNLGEIFKYKISVSFLIEGLMMKEQVLCIYDPNDLFEMYPLINGR